MLCSFLTENLEEFSGFTPIILVLSGGGDERLRNIVCTQGISGEIEYCFLRACSDTLSRACTTWSRLTDLRHRRTERRFGYDGACAYGAGNGSVTLVHIDRFFNALAARN